MSIDYDRLRELLGDFDQAETPYAKWESHTAISVRAVATTRDLLRLRRELTDLRDLMLAHEGYLRRVGQNVAANYVHKHERRLAQIIQGDTE